MSDEKDEVDLSHLSEEQREIVRRGREHLKQLRDKPKFGRSFQDRVASAEMDVEPPEDAGQGDDPTRPPSRD